MHNPSSIVLISAALLPICAGAARAQVQFTQLGPQYAWALSADGQHTGGERLVPQCAPGINPPVRWSLGGGMMELGLHNGVCGGVARGISADGSVLVGESQGNRAFRWQQSTGRIDLGVLPGYTAAAALAVSADGAVVVGYCSGSIGQTGFVWTQATGMMPLPVPDVVSASAISPDGNLVAGSRAPGSPSVAFLWNRSTNQWFNLAPATVPNLSMTPEFVAPEGRFVVGSRGFAYGASAWIWTAAQGYQYLPSVLGGRCEAHSATYDGTTIVGHCYSGSFSGPAEAAIWTAASTAGPYAGAALSTFLQANGVQQPPGFVSFSALTGITPSGRVMAGNLPQNYSIGQTAFRIERCYANCDDSTTQPFLNVADFSCFLTRFVQGMTGVAVPEQVWHYANCDGSTSPPVLNMADFSCFMQKFAAGCP